LTDKNPSKSACYQRDRRLKIKEAKEKQQDKIDKQITLASKKQKIIEKTHKNNDWDFEGREPQKELVKQYQNEGYEQYNFWGQKEGIESPLDKIPYQKQLSLMFGKKHSE
jgi:hypothetical protein